MVGFTNDFSYSTVREPNTREAKGHHHHGTREEKPPLLLFSLPAGKQLCVTIHGDGPKPHSVVRAGRMYPARNASLVRVIAVTIPIVSRIRKKGSTESKYLT